MRREDVMLNSVSIDRFKAIAYIYDTGWFSTYTPLDMEQFMNADEVINILAQSSQYDWIVEDETGSFTYKNDLNLKIMREY